MTMFHVAVYHHTNDRFGPYRGEYRLLPAFAFSRAMPQDTTAEQLAEWTFHLFNVDPETLMNGDLTLDAASAFLLACLYRLRLLRSLSVGDFIRISAPSLVCWLTCDGLGWRAIAPPSNVSPADGSRISAPSGNDQPCDKP
jgi:hypothetical protein